VRVLERVLSVKYEGYDVRMWCRATDLRNQTELDQQAVTLEGELAARAGSSGASAASVAEGLASLPFCNAVEVIDRWDEPNVGYLIYPEWP
jgi:hypothetical protein